MMKARDRRAAPPDPYGPLPVPWELRGLQRVNPECAHRFDLPPIAHWFYFSRTEMPALRPCRAEPVPVPNRLLQRRHRPRGPRLKDRDIAVLAFCIDPRSEPEIQRYLGARRGKTLRLYLDRLAGRGLLCHSGSDTSEGSQGSVDRYETTEEAVEKIAR